MPSRAWSTSSSRTGSWSSSTTARPTTRGRWSRPGSTTPASATSGSRRTAGRARALNRALDLASAPLVAYLPSDDVLYTEHLATLRDCFVDPDVALAHSGVRHRYNRTAPGAVEGRPLQLVQVMHRRTDDRCLERHELVSDDLERLLWSRLRSRGRTVGTGRVSCEWVDHPAQGHKLVQEPLGGINPYRSRFSVPHPLRFHTTVGNPIDEVAHYEPLRRRPDTAPAADGLGIVLTGELAYNPERVLALEERGHRLHGLWMPDPHWYNTVGPLPFGHVADLPRDGWEQALGEVGADLLYALLNWQAVPFAHHVLNARTGLPFVWHFKEGPFICLEKGTGRSWSTCTSGPTACGRARRCGTGSPPSAPPSRGNRSRRSCSTATCPSASGSTPSPRPGCPSATASCTRWCRDARSGSTLPTSAPSPPRGSTSTSTATSRTASGGGGIEDARALAPGHLHLHGQVDQGGWVGELSRYDAGWLHFFESANRGEIRRANWDDLNYPARLATLVVSGVPVLQRDNSGSLVATQTIVRDRDIGLFFTSMEELGAQLRDQACMAAVRANVWRQRHDFTFDHHAGRLLDLFREVLA